MAGLVHSGSAEHREPHGQVPDLLSERRNGLADGELEAVSRDAHAVIEAAKVAGVYVFGGGIDGVPSVVSADGSVAEGGYPRAPSLDGGFCVLEVPTREAAIEWAGRIAKGCRCAQELRVFMYDPQS